MQPISEAHPEAKLVVLGSGDLEGTVVNLIKRLGIGNNVSVRFEFVTESERIAYYAACDIAVLPSLYEPFGIVSLEAMAMEKPIVVGASGVVPRSGHSVRKRPDWCTCQWERRM
jgi:glycosyltransferase involved in cell wall biosynthesis